MPIRTEAARPASVVSVARARMCGVTSDTASASVRLGVAFVPTVPPEQLRAIAVAVDRAGLDDLWVWEDCFKESGVATAAVALASTEHVRVGIGLLPVPLRNVAITAMEIATLDRIFPGRFVAGIGHGVQSWMSQVGARASSPMTLLEEYTAALRQLLDGKRLTTKGRYVVLDDVALDWPPHRPPPLMLGGGGPRSLALAARLGDGTLLSAALTEEEVRSVCELVEQTRRSAGLGVAHEIVATQIAATGPQASARVRTEVPNWGRSAEERIGVGGDAAEIAASVRRLAGFGITSVAIQPTRDETDLVGLIAFLGREVRPLLQDDDGDQDTRSGVPS